MKRQVAHARQIYKSGAGHRVLTSDWMKRCVIFRIIHSAAYNLLNFVNSIIYLFSGEFSILISLKQSALCDEKPKLSNLFLFNGVMPHEKLGGQYS